MSRNNPFSASTPWGLVATLLILWLIYSLSAVLMPFAAAILLAYLCFPVIQFLQRLALPRVISTFIVLCLLLGVLALIFLVVLPLLFHEINQLIVQLPSILDRLREGPLPGIPTLSSDNPWLDISKIKSNVIDYLHSSNSHVDKLVQSATHGSAVIIESLLSILLIPVVFFYLSKDWEKVVGFLLALFPMQQRDRVSVIAKEIDTILGQYLRGQLLVMLIMAGFYSIGLSVIHLKAGYALGLLTGTLVFIPYLGVFTGFLLALIASVAQDPGFSLTLSVGIVFLIGHLIEAWLITPRVVGERIGLHPVMVIFSLLAFGKLLGFFGILIALPMAASVKIILKHLRSE
ncbi:MAG: AI-2E family transporter [Betaproteobacteria bacterium]|nr:AI-2E family transporter [Betaproteobacteria bacterium]